MSQIFRSLSLYRLPHGFTFNVQTLRDALAEHPARPCGSVEMTTLGFVPPCEHDEEQRLVIHSGDCFLVGVEGEEKTVPGSAVAKDYKRRVAGDEKRLARKLSKWETKAILSEVQTFYLERAIPKTFRLNVMIDLNNGWVGIDTTAQARAEEVLKLLREALGSFPAKPIEPSVSPVHRMTRWLKEGWINEALTLGSDCDLALESQKSRTWKGRGIDLLSDEVKRHLEANMVAHMVAIDFGENAALTVNLDIQLRLRALKLNPELFGGIPDVLAFGEDGSSASSIDEDFAVTLNVLLPFINELSKEFELFRYPASTGESIVSA